MSKIDKTTNEQIAKHTPGPWHTGTGKAAQIIYDAEGRPIADAKVYHRHYTLEQTFAHAQMCAAAPELYEALVMVRDADNDCRADGLPTIPPMARSKIDRAIAKAEGTP